MGVQYKARATAPPRYSLHNSFSIMKLALFSVMFALAPSALAICCIQVQGGCDSVTMENAIFDPDVWVPDGARNMLSNSTKAALVSDIVPLTCCCMAANDLGCRSRWCARPYLLG